MTKRAKPRLGKGLSGLINQPVSVEYESKPNITQTSAPAVGSVQDAAGAEPMPGGVAQLSIESIEPNPYQPRQGFDQETLADLAASIGRSGVIQPILVRKAKSKDLWQLVAGERRWRAAQLAGLKLIPAVVCDASDQEAAELALVENVQRQDLNPIERAEAFRGLIDRFGFSQSDVAQRVGLARASVGNLLRLLDCELEIQDLLRSGALSLGHGKALLVGKPGLGRVAAARRAAAEGWSVRQMERWGAGEARSRSAGRRDHGEDDRLRSRTRELERQLGEHLGTKVFVRPGKKSGSGRLIIEFYSLEEFDGLMERMGFSMMS